MASTPRRLRPVRRTYTPRYVDQAGRQLVVDFALHNDGGPASAWAAATSVGDQVVVTGARGAYRIDPGGDWTLLVADETPLPAVGTILDEAPAGARVLLVAEVADEAEQLVFDTAAELTTVWCHRSEQHDGFGMLASQAVRDLALPHGRGAAWSGSRCTPGATGSWASPITRTTTPARTDLCRRASTSGRSAKEKTII